LAFTITNPSLKSVTHEQCAAPPRDGRDAQNSPIRNIPAIL